MIKLFWILYLLSMLVAVALCTALLANLCKSCREWTNRKRKSEADGDLKAAERHGNAISKCLKDICLFAVVDLAMLFAAADIFGHFVIGRW